MRDKAEEVFILVRAWLDGEQDAKGGTTLVHNPFTDGKKRGGSRFV